MIEFSFTFFPKFNMKIVKMCRNRGKLIIFVENFEILQEIHPGQGTTVFDNHMSWSAEYEPLHHYAHTLLILHKIFLLCVCLSVRFIRKCHWLRVRERIVFTICLKVHKCHLGSAPTSLQYLIIYSTSSRTMKLIQFPYKTSFGDSTG